MKHRFRFFASLKKDGQTWLIEKDEFKHLQTALRLKEGDTIEVFDGKGSYAEAEITEIIPKKRALAFSDEVKQESPSQSVTALALGCLKKTTLEELLPSLVELGLHEIHIFSQEKTPKFLLSEKNKERYEKIILGACKQAKRNYIPTISFWENAESFKKNELKRFGDVFLLSPEGGNFSPQPREEKKSVCAILGSEHGLSEEEEKLFLSSGAQKISFGKNILRSFTAAIAICSHICL